MATNKEQNLVDSAEKEEIPANANAVFIMSEFSGTTSTPTSKTVRSKGPSKKSKKLDNITAASSKKFQNAQKQQMSGNTRFNNTNIVENVISSPLSPFHPLTPINTKRSHIISSPEDSSDDDVPNVSISDNPYTIRPSNSSFFLNVAHVEEIYSSFKNYDFTEKNFFKSSAELSTTKLQFNKYASTKKHTFTQFKYKKPPTLFLLTNPFGLSINSAENYMTKLSIHDHKALLPKHRVAVLLPTTSHWWHTESKTLFETAINRLVNNMTTLAHVKDFTLNQRMKDVIVTFKSKFFTLSKTFQDKTFSLKFYLSSEYVFITRQLFPVQLLLHWQRSKKISPVRNSVNGKNY